jgi:prepilin-type N-terminal cleavage/methylation domain-containing protein
MNKEHRTKNVECRTTGDELRATRRGFSLTEVLIAVGILSVGMVFIAGVFPAGIYFATVATERTVAAVAADEAFAKVRIYATGNPNQLINLSALDPNELRPDETVDFNDIFPAMKDSVCNEFLYPSTDTNESDKQYCWSALCRRAGSDPNRLVQITVFVCRKASPNLKYPKPPDGSGTVSWPAPVKVGVSRGTGKNELQISSGKETYINDGYTIVDDATGRIYRVRERYRDDPATTGLREDAVILLDKDWEGGPTGSVWVVPPPVTTGTQPVIHGRYPCIAVYQKVIRF